MKKLWLSLIASGILSSSSVFAFKPFVVDDIRLEGLQRISEGTVYNYLPVQVGDTVSDDSSPEIIRALFKTGFFNHIDLARDGQVLVIKLSERPSVGKLVVSGNKDIKTDALMSTLRDIGLSEGNTFNRSALELIRNELEKTYYSHGKYAVDININVTELPRNRVKIEINITEGFIAQIASINIIGNYKFTDKELLKNFELTKPNFKTWVTRTDQYDRQKLAKDLETLRTFYLDRGYLNFVMTSTQVSISPNKQDIFITINIEEGEQFRLNEISIQGDTVGLDEILHKIVTIKEGEVFSRTKIGDIVKTMGDVLGNAGYAFAAVNPIPELKEDTNQVNVAFYIEPGQKVYVRRVDFVGNTKTEDTVMRKYAVQLEGTAISTARVEMTRSRFDRTGFFKTVEVDIIPVPGVPDQVDVVYTVEEASSGQIGGGVGYSNADRLIFNANISNRNVFGNGKNLDLAFNHSKAYTTYNLSYNDPFHTLDGISRGFSMFYTKTDLSANTNISSYTTDNYGASVNYGVPMSEYNRFTVGAGFQEVHLKFGSMTPTTEVTAFLTATGVTPTTAKYQDVNFAFSFSHNSLDRYVFPESGMNAAFSVHFTAPGSDLQYYILSASAQRYQRITHGFVGMVQGTIGYGDGYGKTTALPFYKNFYLGGARTIRGFDENSLGPQDSASKPFGGNFVAYGTIALILPNFIAPETRSVRTALFVDIGQVYDLNSPPLATMTPDGLRYSVGASITWMSPMAPLVFSYAIPLNPSSTDSEKRFNFTFGTVF